MSLFLLALYQPGRDRRKREACRPELFDGPFREAENISYLAWGVIQLASSGSETLCVFA